jgi:hypothetical protein
MLIVRTSILTGVTRTLELDINEGQYRMWDEEGILIQDAMPNLTSWEREFIMTGVTEEEWRDYAGA